jgi:hypothetical protein
MADMLALTHTCTTANASVNYRGCVQQRPCKVPIAPMGKVLTRLPRLTLAQLRTLRSTTVCTCRRDLEHFTSPDGKVADVLAPTHARTYAVNASFHYRMYVPHPEKFPMGK